MAQDRARFSRRRGRQNAYEQDFAQARRNQEPAAGASMLRRSGHWKRTALPALRRLLQRLIFSKEID
jgi:hypothetical protein